MQRLIQLLTVLLVISPALLVSCSDVTPLPKRERLPARWERFFFQTIDDSTRLSNVQPLRELRLAKNDVEVRVWRGFGLSPLEGVILNRTDGNWSATHIVSNDYVEPTKASAIKINAPESGWDSLWDNVVNLGILRLRDPLDEICHGSLIDGMSHVVEINMDGVYRTYMYPSGFAKCSGSLEMDIIAESMGIAFYDGSGQCMTTEWFPCSEVLRKRRLEDELK